MKQTLKLTLTCLLLTIITSCSDEALPVFSTSAIKIIHASAGTGDFEIRDLDASMSNRYDVLLRYSRNTRVTLPANTTSPFRLVQAGDTLVTVLDISIETGNPGSIYSLFIAGDSANVETIFIEDQFQNYADSLTGVRFINLSFDSDPVTVRAIATDTAGVNDTTIVVSALAYGSASGFDQFEAGSVIQQYSFEFLDASGNVLTAETIRPINNRLVFKNITLPLIGVFDDGEGGNSLDVGRRIEHFDD